MASKLKTFDDVSFNNEEQANVLVGEGEDIDKLKMLKQVSQKFLDINDFDISDEPNFEEMSSDQFIEYMETKNKNNLVINKLDELNIDITFRSSMSKYYKHKTLENNNIFIFFLPEDNRSSNSVSFTDFKKFITLVFKLDCREGLLISKKDLSPISLKQVRQCNISPGNCDNIYNIISYKDDDFVDLTKHAFVPEVLKVYRSGEETDKFGKENKINNNKLPRQLMDDPLTKFYRGKVGDIFKLRRKNISKFNILDEQLIYRVVIPAVFKKS